MALRDTQAFKCPSCGREGEAVFHRSVNVSLYPETRQELFSGELLRWTCEQCQHSTLLSYPVLYHDMHLRVMIQWFPYRDLFTAQNMERILGSFHRLPVGAMEDYRFRIVCSFQDLAEKTTILSLGLDDRAVELLKLQMLEAPNDFDPESIQKLLDLDDQPRLLKLIGQGADRKMVFMFPALSKIPGGEIFPPGMLTIEIPIAEYEKAVEILKAVPMPKPMYGPFLLIDRDHVQEAQAQRSQAPSPVLVPSPGAPTRSVTKARPWWKLW